MSLEEKTVSSESIFNGRIVRLKVDTVELSDGTQSTREIVDHDPAVVILPVDQNGNMYLIRQYRKPIEAEMLEAPAGIVNPGEDFLEAAKRELKEETGFSASKWTFVGKAYPAPGFCNELLYFYIAEGLESGQTDFDEDERIELEPVSVDTFLKWVTDGTIVDAKTILMGLYLRRHIEDPA